MQSKWPLVIALLIPVLMIILVGLSIYLPALFVEPKINFLYLTGDYYPDNYYVSGGQLVKEEYKDREGYGKPPRRGNATFFIQDVVRNESKEIAFQEAQQLKLDSSQNSPDGFQINRGGGGGGFPFFIFDGGGYDGRKTYLVKGSYSKELNLKGVSEYYSFRFLGWIVE